MDAVPGSELRRFVCTFDGEEHVIEAGTHGQARYKLAKLLTSAFCGPLGRWFPKINVRLQKDGE
jgi:hypothetical protein